MIQKLGPILYLKVDVEGIDEICINEILDMINDNSIPGPHYISMEGNPSQATLSKALAAGYPATKVIDNKYWWHSSGPFGPFALDTVSGGRWRMNGESVEPFNQHSWPDFHFKRVL